MGRISAAERIVIQNRAEKEVLRYKDDHALWHRHVHNVTLDSVQILKCLEMDAHPNTIDVSSRRTGKTTVKELYLLKHLATNPKNEEGIVAPRLQQSITGLAYHLEAIQRSEILVCSVLKNMLNRAVVDGRCGQLAVGERATNSLTCCDGAAARSTLGFSSPSPGKERRAVSH